MYVTWADFFAHNMYIVELITLVILVIDHFHKKK